MLARVLERKLLLVVFSLFFFKIYYYDYIIIILKDIKSQYDALEEYIKILLLWVALLCLCSVFAGRQ